MPSNTTYPGVFTEEIPTSARPIGGASTSNTAFVGYFLRGPMNEPVRVRSFGDFERTFGGLHRRSPTSYAVRQYFLNGGTVAFIVRVAAGTPKSAVLALAKGPSTVLELEAANEGSWGKELEVAIGHAAGNLFDLVVRRVTKVAGQREVVESEIHRDLTMARAGPRFVADVLAGGSTLLKARTVTGTGRPDETGVGVDPTTAAAIRDLGTGGAFRRLSGAGRMNGTRPKYAAALMKGVRALDDIAYETFNILVMPDAGELPNDARRISAYSKAEEFCAARRAFLIADIPRHVDTKLSMEAWMESVGSGLGENAAVYFPRLEIADPLKNGRPRNVAAGGTIAGLYARTDAGRGVWKAPAGTEAQLRGAAVVTALTDDAYGELNRAGVNVLRAFPATGSVVWGARTLDGADERSSEWKYVPVRRTALYIEESLTQGLRWAVLEPNAEPLWAQIRLAVGAFMETLFRQGAFQGARSGEAYLVKCDAETTTPGDIAAGMVNVVVGFAPLRPAEFIIIRVRQPCGRTRP